MSDEQPERRSIAPFVIFGGIALIGLSTLAVVLTGHCGGQELDETVPAHEIAPGVFSPPEPRPGSGESR